MPILPPVAVTAALSSATDAFESASGASAGALSITTQLIVGAVFVVLLAYAILGLWEAHESGELAGRSAAVYVMRIAVLAMFFLAVLQG